MRIRSFCMHFAYDMKRGIIRRWKWGFLPAIMFALIWLIAYQTKLTIWETRPIGAYIDYILFCFKGRNPITSNALTQRFDLPIFWICIFMGALLVTASYSGTEIDNYSLQIIIRAGTRKAWWGSKCIWCVIATLCYFFSAYCTVALLCVSTGVPISLTNSIELSGSFLNVNLAHHHIGVMDNIQIGFFLPVLFAVFLNLLQLTLNLFFSKMLSFLICIAFLILPSYYTSEFIIGNYAMAAKSNLIIENGLNPANGLFVLCIAVFMLVLTGLIRAEYIDFL